MQVHLPHEREIGQPQINLSQRRILLSGPCKAGLPKLGKSLPAQFVPHDFGTFKHTVTVDVVGMMMRVDHVTCAPWSEFAIHKGPYLACLTRVRHRIDDERPLLCEHDRAGHLRVQVTDKYEDVFCNPVSSQRLPPFV